MRCPDCNKFVSYDEPEVEIQSEDIDDDGYVSAEIQVSLPCAECGTVLKEAYLEFNENYTCPECDNTEELELVNFDASATDRYEDTDRHGKKIKNPRYMKHYYGADLTIELKCPKCKHEWTESDLVEEQASGFEEVC